jgi:Ring finger domain
MAEPQLVDRYTAVANFNSALMTLLTDNYDTFERRKRMADVIRWGYNYYEFCVSTCENDGQTFMADIGLNEFFCGSNYQDVSLDGLMESVRLLGLSGTGVWSARTLRESHLVSLCFAFAWYLWRKQLSAEGYPFPWVRELRSAMTYVLCDETPLGAAARVELTPEEQAEAPLWQSIQDDYRQRRAQLYQQQLEQQQQQQDLPEMNTQSSDGRIWQQVTPIWQNLEGPETQFVNASQETAPVESQPESQDMGRPYIFYAAPPPMTSGPYEISSDVESDDDGFDEAIATAIVAEATTAIIQPMDATPNATEQSTEVSPILWQLLSGVGEDMISVGSVISQGISHQMNHSMNDFEREEHTRNIMQQMEDILRSASERVAYAQDSARNRVFSGRVDSHRNRRRQQTTARVAQAAPLVPDTLVQNRPASPSTVAPAAAVPAAPTPVATPTPASDDDTVTCAVCLESIISVDQCARLRRCIHNFHISCIETWLPVNPTCPICRKPILSNCGRRDRPISN